MEENKIEYSPQALAAAPREELRRMLTEQLHKNVSEIDGDLVRRLMAELERRGPDPAFTDDQAVEAACEKFRGTGNRKRKLWYQSWMLKVASVVLILAILFFALPPATQAGNLQDVLGWWSDSVFQFITPGKQPHMQDYVYETDHPGLQQLYDTVKKAGITTPIVPRRMSLEFELTDLKSKQIQEDTFIDAHFTKGEHSVLVSIIGHSDEAAFQHEKDPEYIDIWGINGCNHYVIANEEQWIVTWINEGIKCTIVADCPEEDVYDMIKSIYTSEA